jgi:hypothetical protein
MSDFEPGRETALAPQTRTGLPAVTAPPAHAIAPPPEPDPGQDDEGCRFIAEDVTWRRWHYCGRPVARGVWCAAHDAACHRWRGFEDRQRLGEELVCRIAEGGQHEGA